MSEQVLELSVDETNKLRAELGLAPLRVAGGASTTTTTNGEPESADAGTNNEVLELSVQETNALREKLGLPPLRSSASQQKEEHAPARNQGLDAAAKERISKSKLKREVEEGIQKTFAPSSLAAEEQEGSTLSWAQQMRKNKTKKEPTETVEDDNKKPKKNKGYGEKDLKGLSVAHSLVELEGGSTTVLTLADTEILQLDEDSKKATGIATEDDERLENVNLAEARKQRDGLHEKRQVELGMGRAGGYAGFDDDEFVELGGTQGPSRQDRTLAKESKKDRKKAAAVGFQIGTMLDEQDEQEQKDADLFASQSGKAISLESSHEDKNASDFMTMEEDEELNAKSKKKKKDKFSKKKKKDKKKTSKKRKTTESDDEDEEPTNNEPSTAGSSLLADLEESAGPTTNLPLPRKRKLSEDDPTATVKEDTEAEKRSKYAAIMQKGNERSKLAFTTQAKPNMEDEEEPDDAFLNAALSKARRLNRLQQMAGSTLRGEDAVMEMVRSTAESAVPEGGSDDTTKPQMVFSVDETREFTRALRAREEQNERSRAKAAAKKETEDPKVVKEEPDMAPSNDMEVDDDYDDAKLSELAKDIKEEEIDLGTGLDGTTGSSVAIGRGLGGVLNILKQTGEITKKNAGREEQRGRARDERTYDDYAPLDLSKVVQVDERNATDKDREYAHREIKLEYRDKHGRLLTRKQAFRDLSYQFHGYTSGKRKQEKELQQIAREQAEQRLSSKQASQDGGILGALKATQKATGKAFIVHKTT